MSLKLLYNLGKFYSVQWIIWLLIIFDLIAHLNYLVISARGRNPVVNRFLSRFALSK